MDRVKDQVANMGVAYSDIRPMRSKDGISLFRVSGAGDSFVLKFFENESDRREIENYDILRSLDVPTMSIFAQTDCCLLMEDIEHSGIHRLGTEFDLNDADVARAVAGWYKILHNKGKSFLEKYRQTLYSEMDLVTLENIEFVKSRTSTGGYPVWKKLEDNFNLIRSCIDGTKKTLTYNDFYYTNLVVAKDKSCAFMFDYHLLGRGCVYSDIRNVCSSLGPDAKAAFLSAYGLYDKNEAMLDDVVSVIVTLYFACKKRIFPPWANPLLEALNGDFLEKINILMNSMKM